MDPGVPIERWDELALAADNIFVTREWLGAWERHIAGGRPTRAVPVHAADGRLLAVVPFASLAQGPLKILRLGGHIVSDQVGMACRPEDRAEVLGRLPRVLAELPWRWHVFLAGDVAADEGWESLPGASIVREEASPLLRLDGTSWDELLAGRSRNFREQVRRRERKLRQAFDVSFHLADGSTLEEDLDDLFRLHVARWGPDAAFARPEDRALHGDFARQVIDKGWVRLWTLRLDGTPAASWYGFRFAGAEYYYQAGRDPAYDDHSVGFVLLAHTIRSAANDGMREYRFLRGAEGYKNRFADTDRQVRSIAVPNGLLGKLAITAARLTRRS